MEKENTIEEVLTEKEGQIDTAQGENNISVSPPAQQSSGETFSLENNEEKPKTKKELRLEKKALKKTPEYQRAKIDKLISKQKIKYRGPFSYRFVRIFGYVFMIFAQIYLIYSVVSKIKFMPEWTEDFVDVLQTLSIFSVPLFLTANFCIIISSNKNIKKHLIINSIIAILIYLLVVLIYYRYIYGFSTYLSETAEEAAELADLIAKKFFGKVINYNVFVDLSLFSLFYFFFFYIPRNIKSKKGMIAFRLCCLFPVLFAITATILYGLYYSGVFNLPVAILAILPCRSPAFYVIFFALSIFIKLRKQRFIKMGGTEKEYESYAKSNRSSLEVSIVGSLIVLVVSIFDLILLFINPMVILFGLGLNFYLAAIIPFIFLFSYTRKPKYPVIDKIIPVIFTILVIICYLEGFLYLFR